MLKSGLVLADLPGNTLSVLYWLKSYSSLLEGLRDMNYARVRITERYLASTCDEVFIVAGILRCVSNQSIFDTIKKIGESKRIRVVCTRADVSSFLANKGRALLTFDRKSRRKSLLAALILVLDV